MVSYLVHKPDGIVVWLRTVTDDEDRIVNTYTAERSGFLLEISKDAGSQRYTPKISLDFVPGATFELHELFDLLMPLNMVAGKLLVMLNNNKTPDDYPKDFEYAEMKFKG